MKLLPRIFPRRTGTSVPDSGSMSRRATFIYIPIPIRIGILILAMAAAITMSGCGYSTAGKAVRIPANIRTISVPTFVNQTQTYRIEQTMTAAVVREFLSRTHYKVTTDEGAASDAVLRGVVTSTQVSPLTYDSQTGRASSALVTVNMRVTLSDTSGRPIYDNPNYVFREQYQVSREISSFFQEESPAIERLSRDFAHTLVADILENY